ncbi:uncharacterized protein SPPG_09463 [Spizellomyces punctatus DAOM BR117]|uniref:Uncharacterized protein n=1 Tax=Spizellomyces punctatus (strain DAOM BR117) TaxID=645134 RepID=A0A0L0H9S8_SPIPD|nr:uncharacterized protein SPPG_09463 [Spizellomyces punctatus DAOM BR117]KNC97408.1 hypothetical protein SPPG_09463 [Spizellomyces punctatus DAOM BR117]|eukprot:XP_016605448.1 hypothetical protein SPPG_09463 [Spizellomyces punctatus DAOM BR117]
MHCLMVHPVWVSLAIDDLVLNRYALGRHFIVVDGFHANASIAHIPITELAPHCTDANMAKTAHRPTVPFFVLATWRVDPLTLVKAVMGPVSWTIRVSTLSSSPS